VSAAQADSPQAAEALEALCRAYWYPLYAYVRRSGHSSWEAEDLTQEFFARLLERGFPVGISPDGGKFRSYLLAAMKNFLVNEWHSRRAAKRGGGKVPISLDELGAEQRYQSEPADETTPEKLFERRWASTVLGEVQRHLREDYTADGKSGLFDTLKACLTGSEQLIAYGVLADDLGLSEAAVKMAVHRLRKRYGELLRVEIARTVTSPREVDEELRCLIIAAGR
jgi:RNA polymerase sigma factor (sigma-70 family)